MKVPGGRRLLSRMRWLFSKWPIAELLNKSVRTCWCDLVDWALHKRTGDPDEDEGYNLRYSVSGGPRCMADSEKDGGCYCGKFLDGRLRDKPFDEINGVPS